MTHIDNTARVAVEGSPLHMYGIHGTEDCHTETGLCGKAGASIAPPWHYGIADQVPIASQLELLPSGIIYLGSPYSLYHGGHDEAADLAARAAARLMSRGLTVYAPIPHGHTIAHHGLPPDWPFWKRQCDPFIDAASALVVLKLDGWRDSVGLTYEIARFHEAGKPIVYVTMEDLANG